jgi:hypothetical protein
VLSQRCDCATPSSSDGWHGVCGGQIGIMYVCVKGLLNSTLGLVRLSYCKKTLNIDGNACQTMSSIAMTPWSIKGVFGVISDSYVPSHSPSKP